MKFRYDDPAFDIQVYWDGRAETPEAIAARFLAMVDALQAIDPIFTYWHCGLRRRKRLENVRGTFAKMIRSDVTRSDDGVILYDWGYGFGAMTRGQPDEKTFATQGRVGATYATFGFVNRFMFNTLSNIDPDPAIVSYPIFRAIMLAMADTWQPDYCFAYPVRLLGVFDSGYFEPHWMVYLASELARHVGKLDAVPVVERRPDGGLFLAATNETFDVDNAAHMAGACRLGDAIDPLNARFPAKPIPPRPGAARQ